MEALEQEFEQEHDNSISELKLNCDAVLSEYYKGEDAKVTRATIFVLVQLSQSPPRFFSILQIHLTSCHLKTRSSPSQASLLFL